MQDNNGTSKHNSPPRMHFFNASHDEWSMVNSNCQTEHCHQSPIVRCRWCRLRQFRSIRALPSRPSRMVTMDGHEEILDGDAAINIGRNQTAAWRNNCERSNNAKKASFKDLFEVTLFSFTSLARQLQPAKRAFKFLVKEEKRSFKHHDRSTRE